MIKKTIFSIFIIMFLISVSKVGAYADFVLDISDNGSGSTNDISMNASGNVTVSQGNTAEVKTETQTTVDTGGNSASGNTGDANINTGSAQSSTTIDNTNINQNSAQGGGGAADITAQITGNVNNSKNYIDANISGNRKLTQENIANIDNKQATRANTGENSADKNNGDVNIKTGDIIANIDIINKNINNSDGSIGGGLGDINLKIDGNSGDSENIINIATVNDLETYIKNIANIFNYEFNDLNTGRNSADKNIGSVWIETGDIRLINSIINEDINTSRLKVSSCDSCEDEDDGKDDDKDDDDKDDDKKEEPKSPPPSQPPPPGPTSQTNPTPPSNGGTGGEVLAAVTRAILPATGGYWLFLLTMANIAMFFMGWYLRLRSGNSPGVVYA